MVLQKDANDLRRQYLTLILIITSAFLVTFLLFAFSENPFIKYEQARFVIGNILVWGAMLFAPFQLYKRYNHKIHGANYFMLPALQTEKWTSMFFYCVIVTPVVMILVFTLLDLCLYPFYPWAEKSLWFSSYDVRTSDILMILALQSQIFLGNIWFQRAKMQKTIAAIIILIVVHFFLSMIFVKILGIYRTPYAFVNINISMSDIPTVWSIINKTISCLVAPIGLWIVSFMKMKEQQL